MSQEASFPTSMVRLCLVAFFGCAVWVAAAEGGGDGPPSGLPPGMSEAMRGAPRPSCCTPPGVDAW